MTWFVAVGGIAALIALAILIGLTDGRAQRDAWRRIAAERRTLGEVTRELLDWEGQLIRAAESGGCPKCALEREKRTRPEV